MDIFVARQPIFDKNLNVFGYELLFRSGLNNAFDPSVDGSEASSKVIANSFMSIGMDSLTGGKLGFINFPRDLIIKEFATILPKNLMAIEILESVEPDEEVLQACKNLRQLGYTIALDDFVFDDKYLPFLDYADMVKVDFITTDIKTRKEVVKKYGNDKLKFLAEKVETREEFQEALQSGYTYFQGYFFSKPVIIVGQEIPGFKLNYLKILQEANRPDLDIKKVETLIKGEISLSYRLLKYINSVAFGLRSKVGSIRHALVLLGHKEVRKWVTLATLSGMGEDKPAELVVTSIIRARFCEAMAEQLNMKENESDLFLMGLLSMIDVLINRPLAEVLAEIPILDIVKEALLGERNKFRNVFDLVLAYEHADWEKVEELCNSLELSNDHVPKVYLESVDWANIIFENSKPAEKSSK